ncbi:MAG TPA: cysteine desulfurase NifS, partial [Lachnospiraceae bacterium]|nr:cysteine desulfurase NifS [Lachnospiraceae bacterium]
MLRQKGILFHVDAVQALGKIPIDVSAQHIDLLSLSSHKVYGPKGVGALYVREGVDLPSYIDGGGQERGMRAGTENVPGIVGFGKAVELATMDLDKEAERESALRDRLIDGILNQIPDAVLNGPRFDRL